MYRIHVRVETLKVSDWLENYCRPEQFLPLCRECPDYGKNWSCPPGIAEAGTMVKDYRYVQIIGLKVIYEEWVRREAMNSPQREEQLRRQTYGKAKSEMLRALLALEKEVPGTLTIMAGKCEFCETCARSTGEQCRYPERMRYSYSGLGFDLGRIAQEVLEMPLLWQNGGLPEYNVAVAAFLHN